MSGEPDLKSAAREAWIYALPLIEIATTKSRGARGTGRMNTMGHMRNLADHTARAVTTPNNDTLYSTAQIDLSVGPVTLTLPASGERYISLALMDAYTNNFAVLGTRTTGSGGGTFRLIGPNVAADGGRNVIRAPTNHVWALARILVEGPHDLEAARAVQAGISLQGPEAAPAPTLAPRSAPWADYFAAADAMMVANPPPVTDLALMRRIGAMGLGQGQFKPGRFSPVQIKQIEAGVAEARASLRGGQLGRIVDGWTYPAAELGDFGESYAYRAIVAVAGLAALPPVEAMYMRAVSETGGLFDGARRWRLHFPAGQLPPVNSFWSLSLYEATEDGQFFFADNPLGRYAIGDRTPGLKTNPDGSLDIWIGARTPPDAEIGNWLPAPEGPFSVFFRAYLPKPEMLNGSWRLRPLELAED